MPDNSEGVSIAKLVLLGLLCGIALLFSIAWLRSLLRKSNFSDHLPSLYQSIVGFITDFLDTLGVGSFATTTSLYRVPSWIEQLLAKTIQYQPGRLFRSFFGKPVDDVNLPGTLNVGHTLPTILQALIYINAIEIDVWTLWLLIMASVVGSYLGASFVSRLPRRQIQAGMGFAMLIAAGLIYCKLAGLIPQGEKTLGLTGGYLMIGMLGNFVFGALMTIGVGAYAPIMIMVSLLGMNASTAFPLMMGSCAFLMPVASYKFVQADKYDVRAALGLTLLGLPGVVIAAGIVKSLDPTRLNQLVLVIVIYTALTLLYSALKSSAPQAHAGPEAANGETYQPPV